MLGMLIRHNTPVGRHYIQQIWAAAVKSVMNLSAGSVSATQSRVLPSAALGCHCAPPRVTVSALSTMTAAVITSIGEEKKQRGEKKGKSFSIPGVSHRLGLCGQQTVRWILWFQGGCAVDLSTREFSLLLILPCHYPTHQATHSLIWPWFPNRGWKRGGGPGRRACGSKEVCGPAGLVGMGQWVGRPRVQPMSSQPLVL